MLCGWLMSATINGLMLPTFSEPRTNPSIRVTVGSTGKQKHVCSGTYLSSYCLSLLCSLSLDPSFNLLVLLFLPSMPLSVSQSHPCCTRSVSTESIQLMSKCCTFNLCNWSHFLFTTRLGCAFQQRAFSLRGCGWCGDNVRVPRRGAQPDSQPAPLPHMKSATIHYSKFFP